PDEYDRIVKALGREPSITELGIFSVMWAEHCSYKSSRRHLKKLPTDGARVVQGPGENAGAVDIGDGLAAVFKIESHNQPSFTEPYQGAADRASGFIALRPARAACESTDCAWRGGWHRWLRQQHRHPNHRRRGHVRR